MERIPGPNAHEFASKLVSHEIQRVVLEYGGPDELVTAFLLEQRQLGEGSIYRSNLHQLQRFAKVASLATLPEDTEACKKAFLWGSILGLASTQRFVDSSKWPAASYKSVNRYYLIAAKESQEVVDKTEGDQEDVIIGTAVLIVDRFGHSPDNPYERPHIPLAVEYASELTANIQANPFAVAGFNMLTEAAISFKTKQEQSNRLEQIRSSADEFKTWDGIIPDSL